MKFEEIRIVFIVGSKVKESFSRWLLELGLIWFEADFERLKEQFKERKVLLIEDTDPKIHRLIEQLNTTGSRPVWFIGCNWVLAHCDPFTNFFYNTRQEWNIFKIQRKEEYEILTNNQARD